MNLKPWRRGATIDGLTRNSTIRERWHYRRHGVWPPSYLQRLLGQAGGGMDRDDAVAATDAGKAIVKALRGDG